MGRHRYRCYLCRPIRWRPGTPADWTWHYRILHHRKEH